MRKFEYYLGLVSDRFNIIAAAALVLIVLIIVADVFLRMFRVSLPGAYDLVSLLGAVVISFSLAYTSMQKGHIAVDFLYQKLPDRARDILDVFNEAMGGIFFALLAWQCFAYAEKLRSAGEVSLTIKIPTYPFVAGIGMSCVLLALFLSVSLIHALRRTFRR